MIPKPLRVVVIGGAGVFGQRLCDLLIRDGHTVWVAGRSQGSKVVANQLGCAFVQVDRAKDLLPVWEIEPDVIVDAAGPFQIYGDDPYALPKHCTDKGIHYFDLCDVTEYCAGLSALDTAASKKGLCIWSGVSTVPALSSAVVDDFVKGMDPILLELAILPGNRTPRGRSVTHSIMEQAGQPFQVVEGGKSKTRRNWLSARRFVLPKGHNRRGRLFNLPDTQLFPKRFNIPTVRCFAGLEHWLLDRGLHFFAALRCFGFPFAHWMVGVSLWFANLVQNRGSDAGGMAIELSGMTPAGAALRGFQLLVEDGQGPYVPTIPIRAALRDLSKVPRGAGPAVCIVSKADIIAALDDLPCVLSETTTPVVPLFKRVLGPNFDDLASRVKDSHQTIGVHRYQGKAQVSRGKGFWPRIIAALFRFPKAAESIDVSVTKSAIIGQEKWIRKFGNATFRSVLAMRNGNMTERFGPFTFELNLHVADGMLHFPVTKGWLLGIRLPGFLLPVSVASERQLGDEFRFDVQLLAPITKGLIVRYQGNLTASAWDDETK